MKTLVLLLSLLPICVTAQMADKVSEKITYKCTHKMDDNGMWLPGNITVEIDNSKIVASEIEGTFLTLLYTDTQELNGSTYYKYGERVVTIIGGLANRYIITIRRDNYLCPSAITN